MFITPPLMWIHVSFLVYFAQRAAVAWLGMAWLLSCRFTFDFLIFCVRLFGDRIAGSNSIQFNFPTPPPDQRRRRDRKILQRKGIEEGAGREGGIGI